MPSKPTPRLCPCGCGTILPKGFKLCPAEGARRLAISLQEAHEREAEERERKREEKEALDRPIYTPWKRKVEPMEDAERARLDLLKRQEDDAVAARLRERFDNLPPMAQEIVRMRRMIGAV